MRFSVYECVSQILTPCEKKKIGRKKERKKMYQKSGRGQHTTYLEAQCRVGLILEATSQKYEACFVTDVWS